MGLRPICPLKNVKLPLISIDLRVCFSLFRGSVTCFIDTLFSLDAFWGVLLWYALYISRALHNMRDPKKNDSLCILKIAFLLTIVCDLINGLE